MKALSLWQPWATLIAIAAKQYETRSWGTSHRGPIVIHAARYPAEIKRVEDAIYYSSMVKPEPGSYMDFVLKVLYAHHNMKIGMFIPKLPVGAALCVADLVDCIRAEKIRDQLSDQERAFGNYQDGRYAWKLTNIRRFKEPKPLRGSQGLFDVTIPMYEDSEYESAGG